MKFCGPILDSKCPPGTTGFLPNCTPILDSKCPAGTVGVLPNCTPVLDSKCPPGTTAFLPNCTPILDSKCPPGTTGFLPNCTPVLGVTPPVLDSKCPPGMVGFLPNCRRAIPAPQILTSGICASSPQLPCCKETIKTLDLLNGPHEIADLSFPDCRPDGYYKPKQCNWAFCHCVDANGGAIEGETGVPADRRSIKCPGEANLGTSTCTDGDTKMSEDNCNTCTCVSNIWACTKLFCFEKEATNTGNTNTMNTMNTMNTGTMNVIVPNRASSGEACLSACDAAHLPWKSIGESAPGKSAAWNCMDKCGGVTCVRKCQKVYPNRGEELTVAECMSKRCKSNDKRTTPSTRRDKNRDGVKGGLR